MAPRGSKRPAKELDREVAVVVETEPMWKLVVTRTEFGRATVIETWEVGDTVEEAIDLVRTRFGWNMTKAVPVKVAGRPVMERVPFSGPGREIWVRQHFDRVLSG